MVIGLFYGRTYLEIKKPTPQIDAGLQYEHFDIRTLSLHQGPSNSAEKKPKSKCLNDKSNGSICCQERMKKELRY
jgi:hypothetical protein